MNEEPIYLNYSDALIEQQAFLNAAANNVESYLSKQPWSNKRKDLFRKAYTDIMSREVTGASNATGIWNVQHKGSLIDLDSLSKKEREMYGEAAYFIQLLMSKIPTKLAAEEEEKRKKENLPLFDNKYFTSQFLGYIGNKEFGGQDWNVNTLWNVLDKPNEDGIRATTNRANKLADMLEGYLQTIKDDEVNWEGSPFTDANDFRTRVQNAISALRTPDTEDDFDALNKIGLKASDYLSTGADDIVEYGGKQMTRAEALELRDKLQAEEATKELAATLPEGHILEISPTELYNASYMPTRFKSIEEAVKHFNSFNKRKLDYNDWRDVNWAFDYANRKNLLSDISDEELEKIQKASGLDGIQKGVIKKMNGVDGFYYDTATGTPFRIGDKKFTAEYESEAITPKGKYGDLKISGPAEFTDVEWIRLGAILGDIVSIIDTEPVSAGIIGAGSGIARTVADANEKSRKGESWSFGDYLGAGIDIVTGAIGAIPLLGDVILSGKVVKTLKTLGRSAAWLDVINTSPKMVDIWNKKIMGSESMTVDDWKTVAEFIRGITAHRQISKSTAADRKVLEHRGVELPNRTKIQRVKEHFLGVDTKAALKLDKIKIEYKDKAGKSVKKEIEISSASKKKLDEAKNTVKAKEKAVRELDEVKTAAKDVGVETKDVNIVIDRKKWRNKKYSPFKEYTTETTSKSFKRDASKDDFDEWLKTRSNWDKFWNGSNRYLLKLDSRYLKVGAYDTSTSVESTNKPENKPENKKPKTAEAYDPTKKFNHPALKQVLEFRDMMRNHSAFGIKDNDSQSIIINGKKINFTYAKNNDGTHSLLIDNNGSITTHNLSKKEKYSEAKKLVEKTINEARAEGRKSARTNKQKNDLKMKDLIDLIRNLKLSGFLKQGGTLNKDINTIISEFLSKLK